MTSPYVLNDVFFKRALSSLPATLLEAMLSAELTDPGAVMLYPRYTSEELGIQRETHLVTSQSSAFSPSLSPGMLLTVAGTASAAVLAAKAASSCHEPRLAVPSVVSSLSSSSACLSVSLADGHPAPNAPDSSALPFDATFSTTEVGKEAADGHPALNAPDLSGIPAQTDLASKATLKKGVFHGDSARCQRISQKSRILEKVRESPLVSGLSNLDGGPPIKPVRESVLQFLHAESSSDGFPETSSSESVQNRIYG